MKKVLIVYTSTTGNTQAMAEAMKEGIIRTGAEADCLEASAAPSFNGYDGYCFGCPAMGAEVLEEAEFEPYFSSVEEQLANQKVALFGSYGWGDGQWMRDWQDRVIQDGALLFEEGLIVNGTPETSALEECRSFGERFLAF